MPETRIASRAATPSRADERLAAHLRIAFDVLIVGVMAAAAIGSLNFHPLARYFPLAITCLGLVLATINLGVDVAKARRRPQVIFEEVESTGSSAAAGEADAGTNLTRSLYYLAALVCGTLAMWALGIAVGSLLFLIVFLRFIGRWKWHTAVLGASVVLLLLAGFTEVMALRWPQSALGIEDVIPIVEFGA